MCSMLLGMWTQECMRSSYTEKLGAGNDGCPFARRQFSAHTTLLLPNLF